MGGKDVGTNLQYDMRQLYTMKSFDNRGGQFGSIWGPLGQERSSPGAHARLKQAPIATSTAGKGLGQLARGRSTGNNMWHIRGWCGSSAGTLSPKPTYEVEG
ncbi:MAG: hypothetical protein Q9211_000671 [Gyalolechia sp. 1 TL-2023]